MKYKHIPNAARNFITTILGRPCPGDLTGLSIGDRFRNAVTRGHSTFRIDLLTGTLTPDPQDAFLTAAAQAMPSAFRDLFSRQAIDPSRLKSPTLTVTWPGPLVTVFTAEDDRGKKYNEQMPPNPKCT